jgi:two-component system, chemotaxis family, sensor kinase Cph1
VSDVEDELLPVGTPIDLDNCAREPIHIPGSIQPRGVLVVVQERDLVVVQVSTNITAVLSIAPEQALQAPLDAVIGAASAEVIARATAGFGDLRERNPVEIEIEIDGHPVAFDAILHREAGGLLLVELEVTTELRQLSFPDTHQAVRGAVLELNRATSLTEMFEVTARAVRRLTGFDRVMVYRYDDDYNGEVVGEDKRDDLNSFLGLHYPASDIPAQARALYEKNWVRLIDDVNYTRAALVPVDNPLTGRPLDLTYASLRSVSPIHIEYLQNMGVGASMSISLLRDGRLWGLIACHHYSGPHLPPYGVRAAAEFLGSTLSLRLVHRVEEDELRARIASQAVLAKIVAAIQNPLDGVEIGLLGAPGVADMVAADGIALCVEGRSVVTRGTVPPAEQLDQLAAWLGRQDDGVVSTDSISSVVPELDLDPAEVSGVLAVVLRDGHYLMWFRSELLRTVDWGGDPANKTIAVREGDAVRLSPRKSFERWREIVRRRSRPWTETERADASVLRLSLVEVLYARAEREIRLAETLQRSLLPELPKLPGWRLTAHYGPAAGGRIGGDWYDAFRRRDGSLVVVVGDVAGHGIGAAGTMAQLRNALRAYLIDGMAPVTAIERLNDFSAALLPGAFATLAVVSIDLTAATMTAVLAGHPPPIVVADGHPPTPAPFVTSPPVGFPGASYVSSDYALADGAALVFFSDGLVERRDQDIDACLQTLRERLAVLGPATDAAAIFAAMAGADSEDDATVVTLYRA